MTQPAVGGSASLAASDYWWYQVRADLLRTVFADHVGDPRVVLDVGSADGPSVDWLDGPWRHVTLDIDPRGLEPGSGVCGSALALPFADGVFDLVGAFDVLEHCAPEEVAAAELARVLAPGGRLLISVPAYQWAWSDFDVHNAHHRRYTRRRAVAAIEGAGLEVLRATYAFAGTFPIFAAERALRRTRQALTRSGPTEAAETVPLPRTTPFQDRVLRRLSRIDARALSRRDLPFGSSVMVAARKRG